MFEKWEIYIAFVSGDYVGKSAGFTMVKSTVISSFSSSYIKNYHFCFAFILLELISNKLRDTLINIIQNYSIKYYLQSFKTNLFTYSEI